VVFRIVTGLRREEMVIEVLIGLTAMVLRIFVLWWVCWNKSIECTYFMKGLVVQATG
jgi:hypothetical protein